MKACDFRYCDILPSSYIEEYACKSIKSIRFDRRLYSGNMIWNDREKFIEIDFESNENDDSNRAKNVCIECKGICCKNIIDHQIGIYISPREVFNYYINTKKEVNLRGHIMVERSTFGIINVDKKGNCSMLGDSGCLMGEYRPLWCKIFFCEKVFGREYIWD